MSRARQVRSAQQRGRTLRTGAALVALAAAPAAAQCTPTWSGLNGGANFDARGGGRGRP